MIVGARLRRRRRDGTSRVHLSLVSVFGLLSAPPGRRRRGIEFGYFSLAKGWSCRR